MEKKMEKENLNVLENLTAWEIGELIAKCKYAQTPEMMEYYKKLKPFYKNVSWLIKNCKYTQTPGMLEYFKSLKPYAWDVSDLITNCKYARTPEMRKYYKSLINE